jgi:beta-lactamase class A
MMKRLQRRFPGHHSFRRCLQIAAFSLTLATGYAYANEQAQPAWATRLLADLAQVDQHSKAKIGVYVQDLDTGASASYQAGQRWYLASMVKVPVAVAVLRGVERGQYTLDTTLTLRASDYVDGAGGTNSRPVGAVLSVRYLLEQMIVYSDNTASDMLIDLVGVSEVNALVSSLVPDGIQRITGLGEIRRILYGSLVPRADKLSGQDLILLNRERVDADRLALLARMVDTPRALFQLPTLDAAYKTYYASGLNSGRLDAFGELLGMLAEGQLLTPEYTGFLLRLMEKVATGTHRIKAGLPPDARFAHKTGTQRRRTCDAGLVRVPDASQALQERPDPQGPPGRRVIVVACTRDEPSLAHSELALMQVGAAICRSGLLTKGLTDAPYCHALPAVVRLPADPLR